MNTYKVVAKEDMIASSHTWTEGLDYEVVEKDDYFILASNEGQLNYMNTVKDAVMNNFEKQSL